MTILIITIFCLGYVIGSLVERLFGVNAKFAKRFKKIYNPSVYVEDHMTGSLQNCGMTRTNKDI